MRLKIISDGTGCGTSIIDEETGNRLDNVQSVNWSLDANTRLAKAEIVLTRVPVDVRGMLRHEYEGSDLG